MTHTPSSPIATQAAGTGSRPASLAAPQAAGGSLIQGAAFVLLCLWTRTAPDRLRDQLSPETGACATLGF